MFDKNNEAVSNRTAAIMYGFSALIWIGCMGLNIQAIMAGTEDPEDIYIYIYIITAMTILSLLLMVHYIKKLKMIYFSIVKWQFLRTLEI